MKPIFFHLTSFTNNKVHELHGQGIKDEKTFKTQKFLYGNSFLDTFPTTHFKLSRNQLHRSPGKALMHDLGG
jgi:hypothetical protein